MSDCARLAAARAEAAGASLHINDELGEHSHNPRPLDICQRLALYALPSSSSSPPPPACHHSRRSLIHDEPSRAHGPTHRRQEARESLVRRFLSRRRPLRASLERTRAAQARARARGGRLALLVALYCPLWPRLVPPGPAARCSVLACRAGKRARRQRRPLARMHARSYSALYIHARARRLDCACSCRNAQARARSGQTQRDTGRQAGGRGRQHVPRDMTANIVAANGQATARQCPSNERQPPPSWDPEPDPNITSSRECH
ncbi:Hypothetical predicted protein [Olea europaea subsp. europaea]|uniref:Uncharacterized protein n=1 Tax=Olea europaea subsp. europaea TaxID=158383 RepID=A0A8S0RB35_OLEEU|nr:Hypothetical predicted protein [Olea europaea subsp. europaea]